MLNQDYKEMLSILLENKVDFLVNGTYFGITSVMYFNI